MEKTLLYRYICQQPALWRQLLASRETLTAQFAERFGGFQPDRIVCIGSGSSHYAALMAQPVLERVWNTEVVCVTPSAYSVPNRSPAKHPLYLVISQSGISTNTYELLCALRAAGQPTVAITERVDSPVGEAAALTVPLVIGEEQIGAKTKGVSATVLTLMLLALSVCGDSAYQSRLLAAMEDLCRHAEENLDRAARWAQAQTKTLLPFRHLYVLACGNGLGAAMEGALKLLETNYLPVSCYPLDEYLHGIQNALDGDSCLLCLVPLTGPDRERMLRLAAFARSTGAGCHLISLDAAENGALCLADAGAEELECLEYLPALQMLAAELSAARGIDTGCRRYPDFYSLMGSKMEGKPCQTRR